VVGARSNQSDSWLHCSIVRFVGEAVGVDCDPFSRQVFFSSDPSPYLEVWVPMMSGVLHRLQVNSDQSVAIPKTDHFCSA
jgi:hypothetical protein